MVGPKVTILFRYETVVMNCWEGVRVIIAMMTEDSDLKVQFPVTVFPHSEVIRK